MCYLKLPFNCQWQDLKDLFSDTSSGCKQVNPPGITAKSVLFLQNLHFTTSVLCAKNESNTKRDLELFAWIAYHV